MRDPERIETFLKEIGVLWKKYYPDWRFGQLIDNFYTVLGNGRMLEEDEWLYAFGAFCRGEDPEAAIMELYKKKKAAQHSKPSQTESEMMTLSVQELKLKLYEAKSLKKALELVSDSNEKEYHVKHLEETQKAIERELDKRCAPNQYVRGLITMYEKNDTGGLLLMFSGPYRRDQISDEDKAKANLKNLHSFLDFLRAEPDTDKKSYFRTHTELAIRTINESILHHEKKREAREHIRKSRLDDFL